MKKKFTSSKKSMRVLITILVTLVVINGAMMIATMIASAAVTPVASQDDANTNFAATKVSEMQIAKIEAKVAAATKNTQEKAALAQAQKAAVKKSTTTTKSSTTTTKATSTTKASTTTTKSANATTTPATTTTTTTTKPATTTTTTTTATTTSSTSGISTLKNSVSPALIGAFDQLKFRIIVNANSTYLGYFSTSKHSIEMRSVSVSTFRHEMGHFLDVLKNMPSRSSSFAGIYSREKSKYTGTNATYITKNAQEYFAQSYRNYLENATKLKSERPETYAFIVAQVKNITSTDISRTYNMYSWSW